MDKNYNVAKRIIDALLGKPEAHQPTFRLNRKQKRSQQHVLRKRAAAKNRKRYEGKS